MVGQRLQPRFKGVENFLRKIAFNLGNTPSQTDVKIISCIPIDVTDLQNKIVCLERELEEGRRCSPRTCSPRTSPTVGAFTFVPASPPYNNSTLDAAETHKAIASSHSLHAEPPSPSRASLSVIDSGPTRTMPESSTTASVDERQNFVTNLMDDRDYTKKKRKMLKLRMMDKKKQKEGRKGKTQMVYYTQVEYLNTKEEDAGQRSKLRPSKEETYLADVMERQYRPKPINMEPSTSSAFSWPVCRDEPTTSSARPHLDSDACSCFHGLFHNVDTQYSIDCAIDNSNDYSAYYDSSLYDVVPVKETPARTTMKNDGHQNRKNEVYQNRQNNDVYLEMERDFLLNNSNKPRVQFEQQFTTEYCAVNTPFKSNPKQRIKKKTTNKYARKTTKKEQVIRAMQKRKHDHSFRTAELSFSDDLECGKVYTKVKHHKPFVTSSTPRVPSVPLNLPLHLSPRPILKNAECLTISFNDQETQSLISRSVQLEQPSMPPLPHTPPPPEPSESDIKTETTLNQIKNILHAVLTEVKTNAQKQIISEDKPKKDAVVQNGPSQSNIAANSSFMNSYLFSPTYSFCPYGPSCSMQTAAGSQRVYPPGSGASPPCLLRQDSRTAPHDIFASPGQSPCAAANKCVQNYPLFIQTTGRQCTCCYRSVPAKPNLPSACPQPVNVPSTRRESRNQETNSLIKEIYKSLAVNTNYDKQDASSNYTNLRSSMNTSNKKFEFKIEPKLKPKMVASEMLHKNEKPVFVSKALMQEFGTTGECYRSDVQTETTRSTAVSESASPRGDGVRNLMRAKDELLSTGSETARERKRSPSATRDRKHTPPADERNRRYCDTHDHDYSTSERRDRSYTHSGRPGRVDPPSVQHVREYSTAITRDRRHSPDNKQDQRYAPLGERDGGSTLRTLTGSVSDDETASSDDSECSLTTVIGTESLQKKEKKGLFSKMKKLFTTRRRRRKKMEESSSDVEQEPSSDSDDYETVYSEKITNRSGKRAKQQRPPTPPPSPAPRRHRRRLHSKVSFSRYHRLGASNAHSPRHRHDSPIITVPVIPPRTRRSPNPNMEQEYRRHWTEDLTFHHGDTPRYSSERPRLRSRREFDFARYIFPPDHAYNLYRRDYETRPLLVPPPHSHQPICQPRTTQPPVSLPRSFQSPYIQPRTVQHPYSSPKTVRQPYNQYHPPGTVQQPYMPPGTAQLPYNPQGTAQPPYHHQRTAQQPYHPQRNNTAQDQVGKGGQTEPAMKPVIIPQDEKHLYLPPSYKPAKKKGVSWLKKLNCNCGVEWKHFFLEC